MPDYSVLPAAEGGETGRGGGGPNWLLIGGIGVGGLILLMMMAKGGGGGTTAAGTSINAALGSLQEQALNIMGQVGQSRSDILAAGAANTTTITDAIAAAQQQIHDQMAGMDSALSGELDAVNQSIVAGNASNAQGFKTLSDQMADNLTTMINEMTQLTGSTNQQIQSLQANLNAARQQQNQMYAALSGQMQQLSSDQAAALKAVNDNVTHSEQDLYGAIQYVFYQMPNRYTAVWGGTPGQPY